MGTAAVLLAACGSSVPRGSSPPPPPAVVVPSSPPAPDFDAGLYVAYLVQSSQTWSGDVPLVAGRQALLRIFLLARSAGAAAPAVRARLVDTASGATVQSYALPAPVAQIPQSYQEGSLATSWNLVIPGADIQPGRHLVAEIDPLPGVAANRQSTSLRSPAAGSLDVRAVPALGVTLVPIVQDGRTPDVTSTRTADSWLDRARRIHPLRDANVLVGATYTSKTVMNASGAGWDTMLGELAQKRAAEGSARNYVGVVNIDCTGSCVAGIGYVGEGVALSWDLSSYQKTTAHELGHNFTLLHAPCGGIANGSEDPWWSSAGGGYANAHIGVFGWDALGTAGPLGTLKDPAGIFDHMSYCGSSTTTWTSDHNYRQAMAFLTGRSAGLVSPAAATRQPCLIVAGRIRGGTAELEPAFLADTVPSLPPPGRYALHLLDGSGALLDQVSFDTTPVAFESDGEAPAEHFAMALPVSAEAAAALGALAVSSSGQELLRQGSSSGRPAALRALPARRAEVAAVGPDVYVGWDHVAHPRVWVRDPRTGELIASLRGGAATLRSDAPELELLLTDGIHTERQRLPTR